MASPENDQIIHLNVGGQHFSTSKATLTWIRDTFFTSLLSGRIATIEDGKGAVSWILKKLQNRSAAEISRHHSLLFAFIEISTFFRNSLIGIQNYFGIF